MDSGIAQRAYVDLMKFKQRASGSVFTADIVQAIIDIATVLEWWQEELGLKVDTLRVVLENTRIERDAMWARVKQVAGYIEDLKTQAGNGDPLCFQDIETWLSELPSA